MIYCIPESLDTKILHQLFDCIITFMNSQSGQLETTNSKGDFVIKAV